MSTPTQTPTVNANPPALSELGAMGDEELNVRLAELRGWTNVRPTTVLKGRLLTSGIFGNPPGWESGGYTKNELIPAYCTDANAVAEVRNGLTKEQRERLICALNSQHEEEEGATEYDNLFALVDAKPRKQTIGLIVALS